jgi:hypothetical protein
MSIMFTQGTVAFLDVLGFRALVSSAENDAGKCAQLQSLVLTLDERVTWEHGQHHQDVPTEVQPKWIFISDSLIISSQNSLGDDRDLAAVMVKCVQVTNMLLGMGYLVRGGISRGQVCRTTNNIFGTAYIQAYEQERVTVWPRIQLTPAADAAVQGYRFRDHLPVTRDLGTQIVDVFNPNFVSRQQTFEHYFNGLSSIVEEQISSMAPWTDPRLKWEWARDFIKRSQHNRI